MKTAEQVIVEALDPALRNGLAENRAAIIVKRLEAEGYRIIHSPPADVPDGYQAS